MTIYEYSPHMWRWSCLVIGQRHQLKVFSTHVEVIPMKLNEEQITKRILHVCGGDPHL